VTFVITDTCLGVKDASCVAVCPVDCIVGTQDDPMMFIDPSLCIDCAACAPVCPVKAIYAAADVPTEQAHFAEINRQYFANRGDVLSRLSAIRSFERSGET
jgi:ferredoxin